VGETFEGCGWGESPGSFDYALCASLRMTALWGARIQAYGH
jgi:hypothetical protein